ncbi:MAG: tRNA (adenosine(37)-N6)-threonylcarbamoyltransferase complex ATPase subunit type 1 TsaE [Bacteroidia bacterium]|nr:tRNA (adenosine(37)-N6)-threonylcarbamoyltransferase complex ATPase subunit type 1 TsaE [Bacteroidia bacterium]
MQQIIINSTSELPSAAKKLLAACPDKKIFAFYGQMGAGKTTLIKSLCEVMGVNNTVSSPTFSIVNEYLSEKGEKIFHFDFYRINSEAEAYDMGYEDYFYSNAYCFIEWPERIAELLPPDFVRVNITVKDEIRTISANNN